VGRAIIAVAAAACVATILVAAAAAGQPKQAAAPAKGPRPNADRSAVAPQRAPDKSVVFKQTPQGELKIYFYFPKDFKPQDKRPAIVFWFGGGFTHGSPTQFYSQAEYLASRGLVCALAEYRIKSVHGTGIEKCVEDARSAMRWVKKHAGQFGIDPQKVIASGGSAGGTLSLLVALGSGPDAADDELSISPKPCALVLFNPAQGIAMDSRIEAADAEKAGLLKLLSALDIPQKTQPPAIFFFGAGDKLLAASRTFCQQALGLGARCQLWTADGMSHGFFNRQPWHDATLRQADEFLTSLGYLQGEPQIKARPEAALKRELPAQP
jgi:acetyl esterase